MRPILVLLAALLQSSFLVAQSSTLFDQINTAIQNRDEGAFLSLALPDETVQKTERLFIRTVFSFPYELAILKLAEEKEDRLILHVFLQANEEARFESWVLYTATDPQSQRKIRSSNTINAVSGLYRLKLSDRPFVVRDLEFQHANARIHFQQGHIFPVETGKQITGLFFLGYAVFEFQPSDRTEQQQVELFVKKRELKTKATQIFIRSSPDAIHELLRPYANQKREANPALYERAQKEARDFDRTVYSVRVPFSEELWFAQLEQGELYCEMKTDLGPLLYQHSPNEVDDIMVARKDKQQIISLYNSSPEEEPPVEETFEVLSYHMDLRFQPSATHLSGKTKVKLKSNADTSSIIFRLNADLRVSQIKSSQGFLIYFQERKSSKLHLVLNEPLSKEDVITLEFLYQGRIAPETRNHEAMTMQMEESEFYTPPTYLYSNQSAWYPQLSSNPYTRMTATISVPQNYAAVINGVRTGTKTAEGKITSSFECRLPAKYFTLFVGRLDAYFRFDSIVPIDVYSLSLDKSAAQEYADAADRILRFYSASFGTYPYQNFAIVLRPIHQPGGHAPASVAIVNRVFKFFQRKFARDPLHIPEYPHFLLAHEIAHQWWGQAVGWKTYRDQWLSEGFAQYAAWEYMRHQYGEEVWKKLASNFQQWVEDKSYAGPLILGARLGHITDDPQAFSALMYNKGAFTLVMLKNWMGAANFARCLEEFYQKFQFQKAGVEEFQEIAQKHSSEDLKPFFQQWLYGWEIPEVEWKIRSEESQLKIHIEQKQNRAYKLKIPAIAKSENGDSYRFIVPIQEKEEVFTIDLPFKPASTEIDPLHETLMKTNRKG